MPLLTRSAKTKQSCSGFVCISFLEVQDRPLTICRRIEALEAKVQQLLKGEGGPAVRSICRKRRPTSHIFAQGESTKFVGHTPDSTSSSSTPLSPNASHTGGISTPAAPSTTIDPISKGLLSAEKAEPLLRRFKTSLTP